MGMLHQEPYRVKAHVAVERCHQLALGIALPLKIMGPRCMTPAVLVGAVLDSENSKGSSCAVGSLGRSAIWMQPRWSWLVC